MSKYAESKFYSKNINFDKESNAITFILLNVLGISVHYLANQTQEKHKNINESLHMIHKLDSNQVKYTRLTFVFANVSNWNKHSKKSCDHVVATLICHQMIAALFKNCIFSKK